MKRKQLTILLLASFCLMITVTLSMVLYYFSGNSTVGSAVSDDIGDGVYDFIPVASVTRNGEEQDKEVRGVWITSAYNIDFPSKPGLDKKTLESEIDLIIENVLKSGLNTIFFQVHPTADALYESDIFPSSAYLTGEQGKETDGGFDPLEYIIKKAHKNGIKIHAGVNPFRITAGSQDTYQQDISALSPDNPAVINKRWTVKYDDGKLYFDPGIPEVRDLIVSGVVEIVEKYDVDGIYIDDYFYPYPVYITDSDNKKVIADFDDSYSYGKYGQGKDKGDWRRENINTFISSLRDSVKTARADCMFGVSCAGIWANSSSLEGGSDTNGMQSYFDIYADSKYWIENQLIDYICPQIYWDMNHKLAPFDVLCKWWSSVVDGTGVDLYIGHALYKNEEWSDKTEIMRQIEFARSWYGYKGSVLYGYGQIRNNNDDIISGLSGIFYEDYYHPDIVPTGEDVTIGSPDSDSYVTAGKHYILGKSDPGYPLYYNGKKIPRTQNGYFNMYVDIHKGENKFDFTQNGKVTSVILKTRTETAPSGVKPLEGMVIKNITPSNNIIISPGSEISLSCVAPAGSTVTVSLGEQTLTLKPQGTAVTSPEYMPQTYKGTLKLPENVPGDKLNNLGNITFTAKYKDRIAVETAQNVTLKPEEYNVFACVTSDYSHLKKSPSSSFYNDYLPASVGMRDYIEGLSDGYYKLRFGGYIAEQNAKLVESTLQDGAILSAVCEKNDQSTIIRFGVTENVPVDAKCSDGIFTITLYNVSGEYPAVPVELCENPLFSRCDVTEEDLYTIYRLKLKHPDNYYGFNVRYVEDSIEFTFRNPTKITDTNLPLDGKTIIVDAGHGGNDSGALGFLSRGENALNEKDLNLLTAQAVAKYLRALGAEVIMTRDTDITVELEQRMQFVNDTDADLCISVHHNSLDYTVNVSRIRGFVALWWDNSGALLAKSVSKTVTSVLSRYERTPSSQKLAMCRNHKYPSTLLEMAFMTSAEEYENITNDANIDLAGRAVAEGVINYYKQQEQFI